MDPFDVLIRGGNVVLKDGTAVMDIGITGGVIAALGEIGAQPAREVVDAKGLVVMPGMIDAHVHLNEPGFGHWEGFQTGSAALAAGGVTTYLDMPLNGVPPTVTVEALQLKLAAAEGSSSVDYGLWGGLVPGGLEAIAPMHHAGVIGYKAFMSAAGSPGEDAFCEVDDFTLLEGMRRIAATGKVLALHAESEPIVAMLAEEMKRSGRTSGADYAASRPIQAELEAVNRALFYAELTGCRLHFVHISSADGVDMIVKARLRGLDVTVETCPHYLMLTAESLATKGALAKCSPPLRSEKEREKLWAAVGSGRVDFIASDHSPCPADMKENDNFFEAWGGIAGAQSSLELMVGEGHLKRGLPLNVISNMLSLAPASRFGLSQKGAIVLGFDADLAIVDVGAPYVLRKEDLLQRHKHSPYIGEEMKCRVAAVYVRGSRVYDRTNGIAKDRVGQWVKPGGAGAQGGG
ncbi:allantoinase [Paenibacillus sp. CAU 1782]